MADYELKSGKFDAFPPTEPKLTLRKHTPRDCFRTAMEMELVSSGAKTANLMPFHQQIHLKYKKHSNELESHLHPDSKPKEPCKL